MRRRELAEKAKSLRDGLEAEGLPAHAAIVDGLVKLLEEIREGSMPQRFPEWPAAVALVDLEKCVAFRLDFHGLGPSSGTVLCKVTQAVLVRGVTGPPVARLGSLSVDGQCIQEEAFRTRKGYEEFLKRTKTTVFLACRLDARGYADPERPVGVFVTNGGKIAVEGDGTPDTALYGCGRLI